MSSIYLTIWTCITNSYSPSTGNFTTTQALPPKSPRGWVPFGKKQTRQYSVLLTRQADQHSTHEQVHHQLPTLRHTGHKEGDDDLGWDIELEGVGEEDANGVKQLHRLVQPVERAQICKRAHSACSCTSRESAKWSPCNLAIPIQVTNTCPLDPAISCLAIYLADIFAQVHKN